MTEKPLAAQRAIVTGASSGLGEAMPMPTPAPASPAQHPSAKDGAQKAASEHAQAVP